MKEMDDASDDQDGGRNIGKLEGNNKTKERMRLEAESSSPRDNIDEMVKSKEIDDQDVGDEDDALPWLPVPVFSAEPSSVLFSLIPSEAPFGRRDPSPSEKMGMGCGRCERRDELDYCNLDDREKYFLMFMVYGCHREMTVPDDFLKRFRGEIPREIKLEARNGHSYTVEVAKNLDKLVLRAGWGTFVETYHLQIEDSVVLRYNGNSQFKVIVFDRFGREKASSVVADNAALSTYVQESHIGAPETLDLSRGHSQLPEMRPPTENANGSQGHDQPVCMQLPRENVRCSEGHPQTMQMLSPTGSMNHFVGHRQPMQMQPPTEALNHSNCHPQSVQMQFACGPNERQSNVQRDKSSQGNKTSVQGDSLSSEYDVEVCDTTRYILAWNTHLNDAQKKEVDQKVNSIHPDNPIFVSMMSKCNVTGGFTLSVSKQYVERYVGDKERSICLQRLGRRWEVHFGGRPTEKRIIAGWRKFVKDNDVEMGDICIFELLKKCKTCTMEVQIINAKDINTPSKIGCDRFQESHKDATKTVDHSHFQPQLKQMQLHNEILEDSPVHPQTMLRQPPSTEKRFRLERGNSSQGNKRDSLSSEDIGHEIDALPEYITARFTRLTQVQEKAVKQKVQHIDSEIPVFVVVMQKNNVTGRFTLTISNKYVEKYLGGKVQSIWLERLGQRYQVRFGRRPHDNSSIVGGWGKFAKDNEVKTGDICLFVPLKHRKLCTMKVHIICAKRVS
uniref:Uncharacterized protein n=1 Tax=Avena sativa TaxID=4498 RepID=A0ACD5X4V1_AVESA